MFKLFCGSQSRRNSFQNVVVIHVFIEVKRMIYLNCLVTSHMQERGAFRFVGPFINSTGY